MGERSTVINYYMMGSMYKAAMRMPEVFSFFFYFLLRTCFVSSACNLFFFMKVGGKSNGSQELGRSCLFVLYEEKIKLLRLSSSCCFTE